MKSRRDQFLSLRDDPPHILPSLLAADFGNLEREVRKVEEAGIRGLHLDVMDGCFVPNLTFGLPVLEGLRRLTNLLLDVHLMIREPQRYIEQFYAAGADCLTIHVEAVERPRDVLQQIRDVGAATGIALNPATELSRLDSCLDLCDLVLVMSVPAGFGGQDFDEVALDKLRVIRHDMSPRGQGERPQTLPSHPRDNRPSSPADPCGEDTLRRVGHAEVLLEVDGGINPSTIRSCAEAGAQLFVAGTAVFHSDNYGEAIRELDRLATIN